MAMAGRLARGLGRLARQQLALLAGPVGYRIF